MSAYSIYPALGERQEILCTMDFCALILACKVSLFVQLSEGVVTGYALPLIVPLGFARVPPLQLLSSTPQPSLLDFWFLEIRQEVYLRRKRSLLRLRLS